MKKIYILEDYSKHCHHRPLSDSLSEIGGSLTSIFIFGNIHV